MGKRVFTTVGSTIFSELIKAVLSADTIRILESLGITQLSIQYGTDEQLFLDQINNMSTSITITGFSYSPSIDKEMKLADLIISHAGSGSVLEALHLGKLLVVVPNTSLMDNHQAEVANALADNGYLMQSSPRSLASDLERLKELGIDKEMFQPFPGNGNMRFAQILDQEMGVVGKNDRLRKRFSTTNNQS